MSKTLIIYSTTDGHTLKISEMVQQHLLTFDESADICCIDNIDQIELKRYDKILIGASIRYGKHNKKVYRFIENNLEALNRVHSGFFSVNVVARKPEKNTPETNPYVKKFLTQISWEPKLVGVFAGRIHYKMYPLFDRLMIQFIMKITRGPTDPNTDVEFTDWDQIRSFSTEFNRL